MVTAVAFLLIYGVGDNYKGTANEKQFDRVKMLPNRMVSELFSSD
jgi:hypothetical protein